MKKDNSIELAQVEIAKLHLEPGDTVVLYCANNTPTSVIGRYQGLLQSYFPYHRVLVLTTEMRLEVVHEEEKG